jgi:hypothetical protein
MRRVADADLEPDTVRGGRRAHARRAGPRGRGGAREGDLRGAPGRAHRPFGGALLHPRGRRGARPRRPALQPPLPVRSRACEARDRRRRRRGGRVEDAGEGARRRDQGPRARGHAARARRADVLQVPLGGSRSARPRPSSARLLAYERAYGGASDDWSVVEHRNPSGVGVAKQRERSRGSTRAADREPRAPLLGPGRRAGAGRVRGDHDALVAAQGARGDVRRGLDQGPHAAAAARLRRSLLERRAPVPAIRGAARRGGTRSRSTG